MLRASAPVPHAAPLPTTATRRTRTCSATRTPTHGTLSELDFFGGAKDNFKYHMVNWSAICRPKDYGGLGVLDTRLMNDCLLSKWFWKMNKTKDELWFGILKAKYFPEGGFRDSRFVRGSYFWNALQKVNHIFQKGQFISMLNGEWRIDFNRQFGKVEREAWSDLKSAILEVDFSNDNDKVIWCLDRSG